MSVSPLIRRLARDESGFSLFEVLVGMVASLVVTGALFMVLAVSLHQQSQLSDRVQATQYSRVAMTKVVDELHSACLAREFAPVQAGSSGKNLIFVTAPSKEAGISYTEVFEHKVEWTGTSPGEGKLIDKTFNATGGTWPAYSYPELKEPKVAPNTTIQLGEHIYALSAWAKAGKEAPVFRYYKYNTTPSPGTGEAPSSTLQLVELKESEALTAAAAKGIAAVEVGYAAAPRDNNTKLGRTAELSNLVTFAFASPSSESTITDGPCQ